MAVTVANWRQRQRGSIVMHDADLRNLREVSRVSFIGAGILAVYGLGNPGILIKARMSYRMSRAARALPAFLSLAFVWCASPARANLGGDADSVSADSVKLKGQLVSMPMLQYNGHDITIASGTVVHEYLSPAGKVFAVTWQGPTPPDLRQLFGSYFEPFRSAAAAQSRPGGHRQLSIVQFDFVVQASGYVRAFQGKAYVPSLVPAGVSVAELE